METIKIKSGYKVFSGTRCLKPATSASLQRIRYKLNAWTIREKNEYGAFAVFDTLDNAEIFLHEGNGTKIKRVDYIESDEKYLWKKNPPIFMGSSIMSNGVTERYDVPIGTKFADEVYVYEN